MSIFWESYSFCFLQPDIPVGEQEKTKQMIDVGYFKPQRSSTNYLHSINYTFYSVQLDC